MMKVFCGAGIRQTCQARKAILFWTDETSREMAVWLQLSKIEVSDTNISDTSGAVTVTLPEWLALEKGLI